MPSFLEREQLTPVAPYIAPADQILGAFGTKQSLFGIGAAQLVNTQRQMEQTPLSNPQNQQQLDGMLKTANQSLKSLSMNDMSIGQNQSQALSVYDPILKDQDIMGDRALTQSWNQSRSQAESARISSGGKGFNSDSLRAVNAQQTLFSKSDKSSWRNFYNSKESYNPYYDEFGETEKLAKGFKSDVIEKDTQNGAYITTSKDSSWYKDKWQQYFETNASPQLKAQIAQRARANYYTDMLTMPREAMVQKYTDLRNGLIKKQMYVDYGNMMNIGAQLAMFHNSKDNAVKLTALQTQAAALNDSYSTKKQALNSPLEGADAIGTIDGLAMGTRIAEGLGQYQYFDRIGDSFAHKEEKYSVKPDYAYLSLKRIGEQAREFGIRQSEVGRHNKATEQHLSNMETIDMIKAQADMLRATKAGKGKGDTDEEENNPTNTAYGGDGTIPTSEVDKGSNDTKTQSQGKAILDKLTSTQAQYDKTYDDLSTTIFSKNLMGSMEAILSDPAKQNFTLRDLSDPTKNVDGSGGNANRLAKFLAAAGAITHETGGINGYTQVFNDPGAVYNMTLPDIKDKLRQVWSDPAMFKKGLEAIKGNDPSVNSYSFAAQIEKMKQRIDGEHADIVNQAVPTIRQGLGKYASIFEDDFLSKGKIPTRDDIRAGLNKLPLSAIKDDVSAGDISFGDKLKHQVGIKSQDDLFRDVVTDRLTKQVLGALGKDRTAYNTRMESYMPNKGNPTSDVQYQKNVLTLISGAEQQTKGLGSGVLATLKYAKEHPSSVARVDVHSVDEANDLPSIALYFKEPSNASERAERGGVENGIRIPTTTANTKFNQLPLDDRSTLLNNKALKFHSDYDDGFKSNLSIYNASGDKRNPQFDINPDFAYKALNIDKDGNITGIMTVHKADEVNYLTDGKPNLLPNILNVDPTTVYNMLTTKMIKNRDAVNEYLRSNGKITNIKDLPEYVKGALQNPF